MPMEHCIVWGSRVRLLHSVRQPYGVIRAKLYRRIFVFPMAGLYPVRFRVELAGVVLPMITHG